MVWRIRRLLNILHERKGLCKALRTIDTWGSGLCYLLERVLGFILGGLNVGLARVYFSFALLLREPQHRAIIASAWLSRVLVGITVYSPHHSTVTGSECPGSSEISTLVFSLPELVLCSAFGSATLCIHNLGSGSGEESGGRVSYIWFLGSFLVHCVLNPNCLGVSCVLASITYSTAIWYRHVYLTLFHVCRSTLRSSFSQLWLAWGHSPLQIHPEFRWLKLTYHPSCALRKVYVSYWPQGSQAFRCHCYSR